MQEQGQRESRCAPALAACRPELWPAKPDQAPALFDDPGFFDALALRAAANGVNPDLLFFAFYFQPVLLPFLSYPCT